MRRTLSLIAPAAIIVVGLAIFLVVNHHLAAERGNISPTTTTSIPFDANRSVSGAVTNGANSGNHVGGEMVLVIVVVAAVVAGLSLLRRAEVVTKNNPFRRSRIVSAGEGSSYRRRKVPEGRTRPPARPAAGPTRPAAKRWIEDFNRFVAEQEGTDDEEDPRTDR